MFGAGSAPFYGVLGVSTDPVQLGSFTLAANFVLTYNTNSTSSTPPAPVASFSGTPTNLFVGQSVAFINTSANTFTNSIWSFGDGNAATNTTGANVTNTYATAGTFMVSLTVSGTGAPSTATSNNYVVVKPVPVVGKPWLSGTNFIFNGTNGVPGAQYRIVTSTNVAQALAGWTPVATNVFAADGSYNYTNSPATNTARFFRLVSP
jgi:PKD repeat protein